MGSSSSAGYINIDDEISAHPNKKSFTYNAKSFTYGGYMEFDSSKYSKYGIKSFNGSNLIFSVTTTEGKEYEFKLTNVSSATELHVYDRESSTTICSGPIQNFYDTFRGTINWFPTSTTNNVTGSILGDSISAAYYSSPNDKGVTINSGAGNDSVTGSFFRDNMVGGDGGDFMDGGAGNDTLSGGTGNDTIIGGAGNDSISGGTGKNTLIYEQGSPFGDDTVIVTKDEELNVLGAGFESVNGGTIFRDTKNQNDLIMQSSEGNVTIKNFLNNPNVEVVVNGQNLKETAVIGVDSSYFVDFEQHKLLKAKYTGTVIADSIDARLVASEAPKGLTLDGGAGNDSIWGSMENDKILGGAGNDTIIGAAQDPSVGSTGYGNDTITGGTGENTLVYEKGAAFDNDTVILTKNEILHVDVDTVGGGFTQDSKNKNDLIIYNGDGQITLKNILGKDPGAEVFVNDTNIKETAVIGVDEEYFVDGDKLLYSKYTGTAIADSIDATLVSSSQAPNGLTLDGGAGNDSIWGSQNSDKILGGAGDDTLVGGLGDDTVTGGLGENTLVYGDSVFGADTVILTKNEIMNIDMVADSVTGITYDRSKNGNDLIINNGSHGSVTVKNFLNKDPGAEVFLNGTNLKEITAFGAGGETFIDSQTGKLKTSKYTGTTMADSINGSAVDSSITKSGLTLDGGAGNDSIWGSQNSDKILGGTGDDTFFGGRGNDSVTGGLGENTLEYGSSQFDNDTVILTKDEVMNINMVADSVTGITYDKSKNGNDLIINNGSHGSVTVKNFLNKDSGAEVFLNGTNLKEMQLFETVGSEYFDPSTGKPKNSYIGTTVADVVDATSYQPSSIYSSKGVTIDGGAGNDSIVGSWYDDKLVGGAGNDTIIGSGGTDSIIGGLGDDILSSYGYESKFVFNSGDGNDSITAYGWNNSAVFANGTDVEVGYSDNDLLITYSGLQNKQEVLGTVTVKDFDIDKDLAVTVGKTTRPVLDYLAEDNTHSVSSFDSDTALLIYETGGIDTLNLAADADVVRPIMNVYKDGSYSTESTSFVHTAVLSGETPLAAFEIGVQVSDVSSGTGIEKVNMNDLSVDTDFWYDKVAQEVSGWLSGTSYDSTMDALNAYEQDPSSVDLSGLVAAYNVNQLSA